MKNILTIDVEEYFQVSAFNEIVQPSQWDQFDSRVELNTNKILDHLSRRHIKGTFFVLGWIAERHPELVRAIHSQGHEVACHGYSHKLVYEQTPAEFREETRKAKAILEGITGCGVVSYRAASYSITGNSRWALDVLAEEGFRYDSSIFPILHDRYGIPDFPRHPHLLRLDDGKNLIEFPMSTVRLLGANFPIAGGGYFRLLPYWMTRQAIQHLNSVDKLPVVVYLHPWEFDPEQPMLEARGISRFRHYLNLHKTEMRFERLLEDFSFGPLSDLAEHLNLPVESGSAEEVPKQRARTATARFADARKVSVIVPLYNEMENVERLYFALRAVLKDNCPNHELVFVDDGSKDGTYERLKALKANGNEMVIVKLRTNYGQTAAMQAGFEVATGSRIVTMDGDLQNDPVDIPRLLRKLDDGYDLVCGWRRYRQDSFLVRTLPSKLANSLIRLVTGVPIHDNGCSLKAYTAPLIKRLELYGDMHRFIPAVSTLTGARVAELEVTHHPRRFGVSKYGIGRTFRVLLDLLVIKMITRYACHPLLGFCVTSFLFFFLGLLLAVGAATEILSETGSIPLSVSLVGISAIFLLLIPFLLLLGLIGEIAVRTGNFRPKSIVLAREEN